MNRLDLIERAVVPTLLLIACVVLLQRHSIPYWNARMGWGWGAACSLALEAIAMLMIWRPGWAARGVGLLVGLVLVGVPFYQIITPELARINAAAEARSLAIHNRAVAAQELPGAAARVAALKRGLARYEGNSEKRLGWAGLIAETKADIREKEIHEAKLKGWANAPVPPAYSWWRGAGEMAPVMASLAAFYLAGVWCVLSVSAFRHELNHPNESPARNETIETEAGADLKPSREPAFHGASRNETPGSNETETGRDSETVQTDSESPAHGENEILVKRLQRAIAPLVKQAGSGRKFCAQNEINARDLNWLMHHFDRRAKGEPLVSDNKLAELAGQFLENSGDAEAVGI